jgi:dethiobiotin synthetase
MQPIFVTGIGTGIGKTLIAAILTEALQADYWKPVQAGFANGTDSEWVANRVSNPVSEIHPEAYKLSEPVSPHIAARNEGLKIELDEIVRQLGRINEESFAKKSPVAKTNAVLAAGRENYLIIEGAGGLLVPLNENEFVIDLAAKTAAMVILVSRNYLGSINHSLLTAWACRERGLNVVGWIFNDHYLAYSDEIASWSGFPVISAIPFSQNPGKEFVLQQAKAIRPALLRVLGEQPLA